MGNEQWHKRNYWVSPVELLADKFVTGTDYIISDEVLGRALATARSMQDSRIPTERHAPKREQYWVGDVLMEVMNSNPRLSPSLVLVSRSNEIDALANQLGLPFKKE